ncbi:MAG: M20/M25/M40 family metallo-hydrolase [Candidatus Thorarchaeota archaeon]
MLNHINLLRRLVSFSTVNNPVEGIQPSRKCPDFLLSELSKVGGEAQILEQQGFFSVLATFGSGHPVSLLMAHFDVVPIGPGWKSDPFELTIEGNRGYGRGAADDKGNVAALLMTAEAIADQELPGTVVFAMTGDEEIGGANGATLIRNTLEKQDLFPDYLVTADGVGMRIVTRRRNTIGITISVPKQKARVTGTLETQRFTTEYVQRQTRHSAYFLPGIDRHALLAASGYLLQHPDIMIKRVQGSFVKSNVVPNWFETEGVNPSDPEADVAYLCDKNLSALLRTLLPLSRVQFPTYGSDYGITLCPNLLYEHDKKWEVYFDGRAMATESKPIEEALKAVLVEKLNKIPFQLTVRVGKGFMNTPADSKIVKIAKKIAIDLSLKSQPIELGGASDTRHFLDRHVEAIDFGPLGFGVHGSNEFVLLDSIPQTAEFYTQLVNALHLSR